jgi:hypothetical protein
MSEALNFYSDNKKLYNDITVLDGTVDFGNHTEFISKSVH